MPPLPPPGGIPPPAAPPFLGSSVIMASVVLSSDATDAGFWIADARPPGCANLDKENNPIYIPPSYSGNSRDDDDKLADEDS